MTHQDTLKATLNRVSDGVFALDSDWNYTYVNSKAAELAGMTVDDMVGKNIWQLFPSEVGSDLYNTYRRALENQEHTQIEYYYDPLDLWFENKVFPSPEGITVIFSNISIRKQSESKLQSVNKKLTLLERFVYHTDDAFQVSYEDGTLVYMNEEACARLGIDKTEVHNYSVSDFEVLYKDKRDWDLHVEQLKREGSLRIESTNLNQKTGKFIRVEVQVRHEIIDGTGYVIAISRDISKTHTAETKLMNHQLMSDHILNSISDGISMIDMEGKQVRVNDAFCKMTGFEREELLGEEPPFKYWPENVVLDLKRSIKENLAAEFHDFEMNFKMKSGELFPVMINPSPIFNHEGESVAIIATVKDMTEWNAQQKKVKESEEKFRTVLEASGLGFVDYDIVNDKTYRTLEHDKCFGSVKPCDEWNLSSFVNCLHPDDKERVLNYYNEAINNGEQYEIEYRVIWDDGSVHWLVSAGKAIQDAEGNPIRLIGIATEITKRKRDELKIQQSMKEKTTLLAEIHHRVKNNLAVVSGLMQLHAFETDNDEVKERLTISINRVKSIALIHEELYRSNNFSEICLPSNIKSLCKNIADIYDPKGKAVTNFDMEEISLNINKALPCALLVNEVLTNVYKHAFKDRLGTINVTLREAGDRIMLIVSDDGPGLPDRIQEDKRTSMGFNLINNLTDQLDGEVNISSECGCTVELLFDKD